MAKGKKNPVAKALRSDRFRKRIVVDRTKYNRKKQKPIAVSFWV